MESLSDKIFRSPPETGEQKLFAEDVKEFIKEVRSIILSNSTPHQKLRELDKLAGEKLI